MRWRAASVHTLERGRLHTSKEKLVGDRCGPQTVLTLLGCLGAQMRGRLRASPLFNHGYPEE